MITAEGTGTSGGVTSFDVLEVDELTVNSKLNLSKAAAKTTNFGEFQVEENRMQLDPESSYNALNFSAPNIVLDGNVSILGVASTIRQTDIQTTSIQMYDNVATIGEMNTADADKGIHCVYYDELTTTNKHDFFGTTKNLRQGSNPIFTFLTRVNGMDKPEIELVDEDKIYSDRFYKTFQSNIIGDAEFSRVYLNTLHCNNHQFINDDKLTLTNGTNIFEVNFGTKTVESIPEIIIYSYPTYEKLPTLTFKNTVTETPDYFDPLTSVDMDTTSGVIDFGTTVNFARIGSGQETSATNLGKLSILVKNNSRYKDYRFESDGFINTQNLNVDSLLICNYGMKIKGVKHRVMHMTSAGTAELTELHFRLNPTHSLAAGDSTFIMIEEFTPVKYFNNNIYKAYHSDSEYIKIYLPIDEVNLPYPLPYSPLTYTYNVYFVESKDEQSLISGTKFNKSRILKQEEYKFSYKDGFNLLPGKLNLNNDKNEGILLENDNSCLKITTKKSTFFVNGSKKPYFNIIEKPKNYQQTDVYGSTTITSSSGTTTSTRTTGVYIPQYVVDSAHTHNLETDEDTIESHDNETLISKTKLLLFRESEENYQQISIIAQVEDSVTVIEEEIYDTDKVPFVLFNETSENYQMISTQSSEVENVQSIVVEEENIEKKTKLVLFTETENNYLQINEKSEIKSEVSEVTKEDSKLELNKTKLVLFDETNDNYLQIKEELPTINTVENEELSSVKNELGKTKLVLFDETNDNYLQIKEELPNTNTIENEDMSSVKNELGKTKLVLFNDIKENYLQRKDEVIENVEVNSSDESLKNELNKTKLVLFDESDQNYLQVKNELLNTVAESNNLKESESEKLLKTKLVLFENSDINYLQVGDMLIDDNSTSLISTDTNSEIGKRLSLDFNLDNSLISYDLTKNLIFNETTLKNTLNVERINISSDLRIKENVKILNKGLNIIDKINCYDFNFIGKNEKVYGVIAQEIEEVLPHLVNDISNIKRVDYIQFTPILINCVKELKSKNKILEDRVSNLENKLEKILKLLE